jgi:hypothetical protein
VSLYTQLADDAVYFEGERILKETAEETFYEVLKDYFAKHHLTVFADQISIAEQYWQTVGMGKLQFVEVGKYTVRAEMLHSHVDQGWLIKWGVKNQPVNFITSGFVAAVAALVSDRPTKSYAVKELKSLVSGDNKSVFKATLK